VSKPGWYRIRIGAPLAHLSRHLLKADEYGPWRIIRGGILTGTGISSPDEAVRLSDSEITVIREHASRDLYRFLNPGFEYDSYARVTMSTWLPLLRRRLDSSVHGGVRPCVQCNFCDEVCPVGIYPHLIWKQVAAGLVEETFRLKPHRCVACGLCDYVCPSKIDISRAVRSARAEYLKGKMS
jgi:Na+-transporting NADH:ubiquinone oxidoreductase subunit A